MVTIGMLLKDMTHSSIPGIIGVSGIALFFTAIVVSALWRISQLIEEDKHHHH